MLQAPQRLPDFDQAATDRRFLSEVDRLLTAGLFGSYTELATALGIRAGVFSEIASGRYHCNLKLLYSLVQHFGQADLDFILFGAARSTRPEPVAAPARARGRRRASSQSH